MIHARALCERWTPERSLEMVQPKKPRKGGSGSEVAKNGRSQMGRLERKVNELSSKLKASEQERRALAEELKRARDDLRLSLKEQREIRTISAQLERQAMLLERDREVVRELRKSLEPVWITELEGIEVAVENVSGARLAGDFCDFIRLTDTTFAFLIADVSGFGLPAAVIMTAARMAFRTFSGTEPTPKAVMQKANEALVQSTLAGHYLTAFFGVLDMEMLNLQYANASHCCPCLIRDGSITLLDTDGLFVGMFEEPEYEEKSIQLQRNDKLFLFTDGLLGEFEAGGGNNREERLYNYLLQHAHESIHDLVGKLAGEIFQEPRDEVTLVGIEVLRKQLPGKRVVISSIPSELARVEAAILPVLSAKGYGERTLFAIRLSLEEAVINAIRHGNQLDSTKRITVDFKVAEDRTIITVSDEGDGFDLDAVPDPTSEEFLERESGRGLALMRAYLDELTYNEAGNQVTMVKYAPWADA